MLRKAKMQDGADLDDRRPMRATGKLIGIPGSHIDCEIRSIDGEGAMVEMTVSCAIPSHVDLWEDAACSIYTCKVLWQHGRLLGLRFINPLKHGHARQRMLDQLNHCTTYAWARAA